MLATLALAQREEASSVVAHLRVELGQSQQQLRVKENALAATVEEKGKLLNQLCKLVYGVPAL